MLLIVTEVPQIICAKFLPILFVVPKACEEIYVSKVRIKSMFTDLELITVINTYHLITYDLAQI